MMGKGMTAMKAAKYLPISAACLMVFAAATPAMSQSGNSGPSVTIETTSASLLVGGQSGAGILTLPNLGTNCSYPFKVGGWGGGLQVGVSDVSAAGPVQNLTRLEDFAGSYDVFQGQSTLFVGGGGMSLKNKNNNVEMGLTSRTQGFQLGLGLQGLKITMPLAPQNAPRFYVIEFGFNKDWLSDEGRKAVNQLISAWKCQFVNFEVVGHSDTVGKEDAKLELSDKRASSVRDYMLGAGVAEPRVTAHGVGSNELRVQTPASVRLRDNRVVIVTVK
jgi:outer membrane protein OmpA-like peptidoglycan-associated protein